MAPRHLNLAPVWAFGVFFAMGPVPERCSGAEFFSLNIVFADGARTSYLHGEDVKLRVTISAPAGKALRYMSDGTFMFGVVVVLSRDGIELPRTGPTTEPPAWSEVLVREMRGTPLQRTVSLGDEFGDHVTGALPPGTYKVAATVAQPRCEFGLAVGKAASNEMTFTVRQWAPARASERIVHLGQTVSRVRLVETTQGDFLVCWSRRLAGPKSEYLSQYLRVVPIKTLGSVENVLWTATHDHCYILHPPEPDGARKLTLAEKDTSSAITVVLSSVRP